MFDIQGTTIYLTRGDKAIIGLTLKDYIFKIGDIIDFKVYNANELNKSPVLNHQVKVEEESAIKWLNNGAIPTDTVRNILSKEGIMKKYADSKKKDK